jgi:hypothetical protein
VGIRRIHARSDHVEAAVARVGSDRTRVTRENTMSTITQKSPQLASAQPAHPVSEMIEATEVPYRLTVREYEQIAGSLDDDPSSSSTATW